MFWIQSGTVVQVSSHANPGQRSVGKHRGESGHFPGQHPKVSFRPAAFDDGASCMASVLVGLFAKWIPMKDRELRGE